MSTAYIYYSLSILLSVVMLSKYDVVFVNMTHYKDYVNIEINPKVTKTFFSFSFQFYISTNLHFNNTSMVCPETQIFYKFKYSNILQKQYCENMLKYAKIPVCIFNFLSLKPL